MLGINHLLISGTATSLILGTASPTLIVVGAIAGLFPDIDVSSSPVGKVFPWISSLFEKKMPHRSCTHSLLASVIVAIAVYSINFLMSDRFLNLANAVTIGYFFGWFADLFTRSGVEMFFPSRVRWVCPGNRNLRIKTGSSTEYFILVLFVVIALLTFNLNNSGGLLTQFNRLIGGTSGVEQIYNESGADHLIVAHVEGVRQSDRSRINADFTIIQAQGRGFIVQSKSGEIYKVGSDPDCQILSDRITADKSKPAITTIESIFLEDEEVGVAIAKFDRQSSASFLTGEISIDEPDDLQVNLNPYEFPYIKKNGSSVKLEAAPIKAVIKFLKEQLASGQLSIRTINSGSSNSNAININ